MNKFKPIDKSSRSTIVFETLKDSIFRGELEPGEALKELHLANSFNVSQSTIREALVQLEQFGLAEKVPNKGTRVINKSEKDIADLLIVRFYLEELAAIQASANMNKKDLAHLKAIDKKINEAAKNNQYFELIKYDLEFHKFIWEKSENIILADMLEKVSIPLFASVSIKRSNLEHSLEKVLYSHGRIVDAIASKDIEQIKKEFRADLKESYGSFMIDEIPYAY